MPGRSSVLSVLLLLIAAVGCERDPLPFLCPDIAEGALVVSEIRGPQSGDIDGYEQWIELYNAGLSDVDLEGLHLVIQKLDGSAHAELLVRSTGVIINAGEYAVFGRSGRGQEPAHVDYGYQQDFGGDLYDTAAIDVVSCGVLVDRVIYRNLPNTGTWALDGLTSPDAEVNDRDTAWCLDDIEDIDTPSAGIRGTPGQPNLECPS